ncbi:MAG: response regulator [Polyangiaceae bacterium]
MESSAEAIDDRTQHSFVEPACVLLAEDDAELRSLLVRALRRDGYRVVESKDGSELLDTLARDLAQRGALEGVDLIISDIRMPGYTGLNVLCGLRQAGMEVPFIVMTGFGDDDTLSRAYALGASCVLTKPFDSETLRHVVVATLTAKRPRHVPVHHRH